MGYGDSFIGSATVCGIATAATLVDLPAQSTVKSIDFLIGFVVGGIFATLINLKLQKKDAKNFITTAPLLFSTSEENEVRSACSIAVGIIPSVAKKITDFSVGFFSAGLAGFRLGFMVCHAYFQQKYIKEIMKQF